MNQIPLVVDLDGTLVLTDTLQECFLALLRHRPWTALCTLCVIPKGRVRFKESVGLATPLEAAAAPFHAELLEYLTTEADAGRRLILATGACRKIAEAIASHLGIFEAVLSTEGKVNLTGTRKAAALAEYFGNAGYLYAGNSHTDLAVWAQAEAAIVVNAPPSVLVELRRRDIPVHRVFPRTGSPARLLIQRLPILFAASSRPS